MNSIFTNALPGQNEDDHTYTLKERFNQQNEGNSGNNNNNIKNPEDINRYDNNQNEEQIMQNMHQREKFNDYDEQNMIREYSNTSRYFNHSRSSSRSRKSRNRDRSRSRDRYRRDNQRSRSKRYSKSNSRNYGRSRSKNNDYRKRRGENEIDNNTFNRNYSRSYPLFSYTENGVTKINTYFTVPEHLVSLLIGKKGENVRAIMNSTGAVVTFCKEVRKNIYYNCKLFFYSIMMMEKLTPVMELLDYVI